MKKSIFPIVFVLLVFPFVCLVRSESLFLPGADISVSRLGPYARVLFSSVNGQDFVLDLVSAPLGSHLGLAVVLRSKDFACRRCRTDSRSKP
jgi:hypothetical protein